MTPHEAIETAKRLWISRDNDGDSVMRHNGSIIITDGRLMVVADCDSNEISRLPVAKSCVTSWIPTDAPIGYGPPIALPKVDMQIDPCTHCVGTGSSETEEGCRKCGSRVTEECRPCRGTGVVLVGRDDKYDLGPLGLTRYYIWLAAQLGYTHVSPDKWYPREKPAWLSPGPPAWVMPCIIGFGRSLE